MPSVHPPTHPSSSPITVINQHNPKTDEYPGHASNEYGATVRSTVAVMCVRGERQQAQVPETVQLRTSLSARKCAAFEGFALVVDQRTYAARSSVLVVTVRDYYYLCDQLLLALYLVGCAAFSPRCSIRRLFHTPWPLFLRLTFSEKLERVV